MFVTVMAVTDKGARRGMQRRKRLQKSLLAIDGSEENLHFNVPRLSSTICQLGERHIGVGPTVVSPAAISHGGTSS